MASGYVVMANFGLTVNDATSRKNAMELAKQCPVQLGTGLYEVEEWDSETGEYLGTTKYHGDGTEVKNA